jgi:hypothetical protein
VVPSSDLEDLDEPPPLTTVRAAARHASRTQTALLEILGMIKAHSAEYRRQGEQA